MRTYLLKRLLLFIPTAFGVSIVIFVMLHTIPGDYATALFVGGEATGAGGIYAEKWGRCVRTARDVVGGVERETDRAHGACVCVGE